MLSTHILEQMYGCPFEMKFERAKLQMHMEKARAKKI